MTVCQPLWLGPYFRTRSTRAGGSPEAQDRWTRSALGKDGTRWRCVFVPFVSATPRESASLSPRRRSAGRECPVDRRRHPVSPMWSSVASATTMPCRSASTSASRTGCRFSPTTPGRKRSRIPPVTTATPGTRMYGTWMPTARSPAWTCAIAGFELALRASFLPEQAIPGGIFRGGQSRRGRVATRRRGLDHERAALHGDRRCRPDRICNGQTPQSGHTIERWFDAACLPLPAPVPDTLRGGVYRPFGNAGANPLTGPGTVNFDFSAF